jgi:hypothetical protein
MQPAPTPLVRALHVAVLAAFAVSQPLFDLLGRHVEFLLAHGLDRADLVGLALVLGLGVPGALAAATGLLERMAGRAAPAIHGGVVALLVAVIALPVLARAAGPTAPAALLVAIGAGLGIAAAVAYARAAVLRRLLTVASPALLAFPLLFLIASPVSSLLFPQRRSDDVATIARKDIDVVVVVFDGLPLTSLLDESGAIDPRRFPHLAALAETAHFFRNATTVTETTEYAVPAIATGLYPMWDLPPTTDAYPQNLFTLLAETHELNVFEPLTRLCPPDLCVAGPAEVPRAERWAGVLSDLAFVYAHAVLPPEWRRALPDVTSTWRDFARPDPDDPEDWHRRLRSRRGDMRWVFAEFLARVANRGRPALHFLHANVPHGPYKYLPSGVEYRPVPIHPNTRKHGGTPRDLDWAETQALQRHLLQVAYADALWGALRRRLEAEGLWDDSLVVVTADHGVSFKPGLPSRQLGSEGENAADLLLVPLLVKLPGQRVGHVSDRNVETVDILPTIVDVLGGALPRAVDGRSLLDASAPERKRKLVFRDQRRGPRERREQGVLVPDIPNRDATVSRIAELFGRGTGVAGLYAVGPHRELLGRGISALPLGTASPLSVRLDGRADYDAVDTASGYLPALVAGSLRGPAVPADPLDLAVAVNGTVRAVTRTFEHTGDGARFVALVPEDAFRDGGNDVEVLVVTERPEGLVLSPTRVRPTTRYAAVTAPDGTLAAVLSSEGRLYPVVEHAVEGHVRREGDTFAGGLIDARRGRTADAVLLFEDGRFRAAHPVGSGPVESVSKPAEGVVRIAVPPFEFPVPGIAPDDGGEGRLRFLGISASAASELSYRTNFRLRGAWPGPGVALSLEEREGREGIAASTGEWIALGGRGIRGRFRSSGAAGGAIAISGWAADAAGNDSPPAALVFAAGRFAGTVAIDRPCPDEAPGPASPEAAPCGFDARLPAGSLGGATPEAVRVLVTTPNGAAAELEPERG